MRVQDLLSCDRRSTSAARVVPTHSYAIDFRFEPEE
jgi:hypothetical protein